MKTVMAGVYGELIFYFVDGRAVGLILRRELIGPLTEPGVEVVGEW